MKKYFFTKRRVLVLERNDDNTLRVTRTNGDEILNAGLVITDCGGVEKMWSEALTQEEFDRRIEVMNAAAAARKAERERTAAERADRDRQREEEYLRLAANQPIEATYDNIGTVIRHLNSTNWGGWELPKMTIGYTANQYDCDGKTATTMKFDEDIYDGEDNLGNMFVIGAPVGHLMKYRRVR